MLGRLFERLEQRVECRLRKHVDLVYDVGLSLRLDRRIGDILANVPHIVHRVVRGAVYFEHIRAPSRHDLDATLTGVARLPVGLRIAAVHRLDHEPRERRLAGAADAGKEHHRRQTPLSQGIGECFDDGILAHHFGKSLRAPLPGNDLITHWLYPSFS